tara:strand:- start:1505 stop:2326 length:822 start_codon:yes stop_codon:yes gene_type:complete
MITEDNSKLSIESCFSTLKSKGKIALMPFLMAGDPDLFTTSKILLKLQESGADIVELGIPYSDPLADGPVIQAAASRSLSKGTTPLKVFEMLREIRGKLTIPIVIFTYSNPLIVKGMECFCEEASLSGVSGIVVPDLPLEEAEKLSFIASKNNLDLILLVAPTTPKQRMKKIVGTSKGFTYLVSVTGVTGERSVLEDRVEILVKQMKLYSKMPIAVGFGISGPEQIKQVKRWGADGAIVGSALVKRIHESDEGKEIDEASKFCIDLRKAADCD